LASTRRGLGAPLLIGQLPEGITIRIYGGMPCTPHSIGANLTPNTSTTLPLTVLRPLATPGEVTL
jgi:hypothetical protein